MNSELTNLLPSDRQRALSRDYFLRLITIIALSVAALAGAAAILLIPTYVFLRGSAATKANQLSSMESVLSSADEKALSAHLTTLSTNAAVLVALGNASSVSTIMRAALAVSRPGISLTAFNYVPAAGKNPGILTISGSAATRDALRNYQMTLQSAPFAVAANLPVSAYAKDTNIPFSITVTLAP